MRPVSSSSARLRRAISGATDKEGITYVLEQSLWDASMLCGLEGQWLCAVWTIMLMLGNLFAQGMLAGIVLDRLTKPQIDDADVAGFRTWRTNIGHAKKYVDPISELSLAARVCADNPDLELSSTHSSVFELITNYQGIGPVLSVLCLFVWFMRVIGVMNGAIHMIMAAVHLRAPATNITVSAMGKQQVKALSTVRTVWVIITQAVRLAIAICLGVGGTLFLGRTIDLTELILNTMALDVPPPSSTSHLTSPSHLT